MTTTLQLALTAGALVGLGAAVLVWRLAPARPDLDDTLHRLAPERSLPQMTASQHPTQAKDRLGLWLMRRVPLIRSIKVPERELAILRIPVHRYYGEKALFALVGLIFPPAAVAIFSLLGLRPPIALPLVASIAFALLLSLIPNYNARSDAIAARAEFSHALSAYIDLVALERNAGSGPRQSLEYAAQVGDSWVFRRIAEELARSRWSGITPWDSLTALADELGLPDLADLSDIMRLSGEEGAAVYKTLRSRSASMRAAILNADIAKANATGERMSMPSAVLVFIFIIILIVPAMLRVIGSG